MPYAMGIVGVKKDMGKYDGWTCLAIAFSHVILGIWERRFADLLEQLDINII